MPNIPENALNAILSRAAAMSVIGNPRKDSGTFFGTMRSLTPAKSTIARVNPTPAKTPFKKDCINV